MKKKKYGRLYFIIYILLVFLVFFTAEIVLRIAGAGYGTEFFLKKTVNNKVYLIPNSMYAAQFLTKNNVKVPECPPFYFTAEKGPSVYRIYVIGESTSQGFPYSKTEAFPFQAGQMLSSLNPGKKIEVLNFSMSAVNSHIGLAIAEEIVKYPPDLVVLYFGHNEFIGIGGAGEFHKPGFQFNLLLSKLRIYQLIKEAVSGFGNKGRNDLMTEMAHKQGVRYGSQLYLRTVADFSDNYKKIIRIFKSRGIPVIACGAAANLKDFPPVMSGAVPSGAETEIKNIIEKKPRGLVNGKLDGIIKDSAAASYYAGKLLLKNKNTRLAGLYLQKACDLDNRRLRASSDINAAVSNAALQNNCLYIDMQSVLDGLDRDGISGNEVFLEHVHPALESAGRMAEKLAGVIAAAQFGLKPPLKYDIVLYSTLVEKESAAGKLMGLFGGYPFREIKYFNAKGFGPLYDVEKDPLKEGRVRLVPKKGVDANELSLISGWLSAGETLDDVHVRFGHYLFAVKNGRGRAEMEFRTAIEENPLNGPAMNNLAVMRLIGGDINTGLEMMENLYAGGFRNREFLENLRLVYHRLQNFEDSRKIEKTLVSMGADLQPLDELLIIGL